MLTSIRTDPETSRTHKTCKEPVLSKTEWDMKDKSLQPEVMGIAAESKSSTCFSPRGRKQTTHRCYHPSTTNFLIRQHLLLLLPNLSFFSKSHFGQSSTLSVIRHLFLSNRNFHSWLLWEVQNPLLSPGRGSVVWWLQGTGLGSAGWNSWRGCQAEIPLLSIQCSLTHSCSTSPHLLRLSSTLTWHPEWCFYSDKFCRGWWEAQVINCQVFVHREKNHGQLKTKRNLVFPVCLRSWKDLLEMLPWFSGLFCEQVLVACVVTLSKGV